jgi:hypothetical protein
VERNRNEAKDAHFPVLVKVLLRAVLSTDRKATLIVNGYQLFMHACTELCPCQPGRLPGVEEVRFALLEAVEEFTRQRSRQAKRHEMCRARDVPVGQIPSGDPFLHHVDLSSARRP